MSRNKKKSKQRSDRLKRIGKRLAAYSAAAAATAVVGQGAANAADQVHDIVDITVGPADDHAVVFNMLAGTAKTTYATTGFSGQGSMRMIGFSQWGTVAYPNPYIFTPAFSANGAFVVTAGTNVARLGRSALIDGNQLFGANLAYPSTGNYGNLGNWAVDQRGFAGIRFDLDGSTHYGWADVSHPADRQITLHAFGYNDTAGAASHVPEPSSILLLAAGAAGLGFWRLRRKGSGKAV